MTEVSGTFFFFFHSLGLASPPQKSSPLTMSSDRQFEKWLEGPPSTDQVRSRLNDYTTKIQDIARVALDPDSAPFAEAKVKQVRANSNLIQQHLRRTEILAEWLLEKIDEAADITPSRQTAETYLEYVSALDLYHRAGRAGCPTHQSCRHNPQRTGSLSSDTQQGDVSNEEKAQRNGELPSLGRTPATNHRTDSQDRKNPGQRSPKVGGTKERRCPQSTTGICQSCSCCSPSL